MTEIVLNGDPWGVLRVPAGAPSLVDGGGVERLGTTDPVRRLIAVRNDLVPPMLDRVMLHEVAHAVSVSWGMLPTARKALRGDISLADEFVAQLIENHAVEAIVATSAALGRPVCIGGVCVDKS